jgi:ribonuclease J
MTMTLAQPFEAWTDAPASDELRLVPIGGLGEFGMNALAVHTVKSLILVDCGQLFPGEDQPGIDRIVPDFAYLEPFAEQVKAVVLTHGHEDHIGALPYFLAKHPVPVYGTAFTLALVKGKLKEHGLDLGLLREVADYDRVQVTEDLEVEWIPVTHSIPDACALALHTPVGVVVHSGDFKLDPTPVDGRLTGLKRLKTLGQAGVRLLMADSTNVLQAGRTPSEAICRQGLEDAFRITEGALFLATFSTNLHRLQVALDLAYEHGRSVVPLGRSLERAISLGRELGRLKLPDDFIVEPKDAPHYPRKELLILCTGSQGEPQSGLSRLLRGEVKGLKMAPGDRLLLSARPIPGNEVAISRLLDDAARLGAETTLEGLGPVHATGHAHREDLIELIQTVKPRHMVPVHGTFRNLQAHGRLAASLGWDWENISLMDGGHCLRLFGNGRMEMAGTVPVGREFVHEGVAHTVDARILRDRLILQEDGVVFLTLMVDEALERVAEPTVLSRGFVVLSDDEAYGQLLRSAAAKAWDEAPREVRKDEDLRIELLRQALRRIIRKTTDTRPMVVPVVLIAPAE